MELSEYKARGRVTRIYELRKIIKDGHETGSYKKDFDIDNETFDPVTREIRNVEIHFTAWNRKADEVKCLNVGDDVEVTFVIEGYNWQWEEGKYEDWIYNNLVVRNIKKYEDYSFDIEEWRRQQKEEMENGVTEPC
jgi:hypothetical protein